MKDRLLCVIQLALSLVMLMVVVVDCAQSPQTSKYPADISGRVTIADTILSPEVNEPIPASEGGIWWIVQVSVRNISYSQPISPYDFTIALVNGGRSGGIPYPYDQDSIATGCSGQFILYFEMPLSYDVGNTQICYEGQSPVSYGKLSKQGNVSLYHFVSPTPKPSPTPNTESYLVHPYDYNKYMQLKTVASWQGTTSKKMKFTVTQVPCIINYGWSPTSAISSYVVVYAWDKDNVSPSAIPDQGEGIWMIELDKEGTYTVEVEAVGAAWWLKMGVE
jgi:hypothetical protein